MRVVVAMSGGVDSSVAAALLREQGHEVIGVTMQIWPDEGLAVSERRGGCCALGAVRDARAVAAQLGIPYYVFQLREAFDQHVIARFAAAYASGRTPNPCVACNRYIKFEVLLDKARRLGADLLATGHYARLRRDADGVRLLRALDARKDQSYVLYPIRRAHLERLCFPLGGNTKEETRRLARAYGLPVADKPDSQEICFVGAEGYAAVVAARHPGAARPGPIVDMDGRLLGTHRGLAHYTVGQRRGLGIAGEGPYYVVALDAARNTLVVGRAEDTCASACAVHGVNWLASPPPEGAAVSVKVRAGQAEHPAYLFSTPDGVRVVFQAPVRAVTPGQACVFYDGEVVLGGGEIDAVQRRAPLPVAAALP